MSGLTFLFSAALWALPIAGLPLLLHLLFRRKSPVVPFPTLRFIRASVQQTATRRKVHRWLLLALRALALLALIYAISQPAIKPAEAWASGGGASSAAVIVLDTSYSMQLSHDGVTLAGRADQAVRDLLSGQLRGMKVAILRSAPAPMDRSEAAELRAQETFRDAADVQWTLPQPQAAAQPLAERVLRAAQMLAEQPVDHRWLIVISDFQSREFPRSLPEPPDVRLVLIDLHPVDPQTGVAVLRSASITGVRLDPSQPTAGIASEVVVDITGRPNDVRQVNIGATSLDREGRTQLPPVPANLDESGRTRLRLPLAIPPAGFLAIDASLTVDEPLAWARERRLLVQVPPRQNVVVLSGSAMDDVRRRIAWAMDPTAGQNQAWALTVREAANVSPGSDVVVAVITDWLDAANARQLRDFAAAGHAVILFLRPGLEATWHTLPQPQRDALMALLPGAPVSTLQLASAYTATIVAPADPVLAGLTDERLQIGSVTVRRLLPFDALSPGAQPILGVAESGGGGSGLRPAGLVFRQPVGAGTVFTFATLPDKRYSTLHLHPTFPPMLVQMSLRPSARSDAQNVELGSPLTLSDAKFLKYPELRLEGPGGDVTAVRPTNIEGRHVFWYDQANNAGVYTWRNPADDTAIAMANVQYPAAEAILQYTPAHRLVSPASAAVVARSPSELFAEIAALQQPEPRWQIPLAIVMVLLCVEALLGSLPLIKWPLLKRTASA